MEEKLKKYIKDLEGYRDSCKEFINQPNLKPNNTFLTQATVYNSVINKLNEILKENQQLIEPPTKL